MHASEVDPSDRHRPIEEQPIVFPPQNQHTTGMFNKIMWVLSFAAGGTVGGAAIGTTGLAAGILGVAIGIPPGALLGFCIGLALGMLKVKNERRKSFKQLLNY